MENPVESVLAKCRKYDIACDLEEAALYVQNCIALKTAPGDVEVRRIAEHFRVKFFLARDDVAFEDILNTPECGESCPWCRALEERLDAWMAARQAELPQQQIRDRIERLGLLHPDAEHARIYRCPNATEGVVRFMQRANLTAEDIDRMTDDQLRECR